MKLVPKPMTGYSCRLERAGSFTKSRDCESTDRTRNISVKMTPIDTGEEDCAQESSASLLQLNCAGADRVPSKFCCSIGRGGSHPDACEFVSSSSSTSLSAITDQVSCKRILKT